MHLIRSGKFSDRSILLVDKDDKTSNDRTWCVWQKEAGLFEEVVYRSWDSLEFFGENFERKLAIYPYRYKMIRGLDFYRYCLEEISRQPNFTIIRQGVDRIFSEGKETGLETGGQRICCDYLFNSILFEKPKLNGNHYWLLQHFKGWVIQSDRAHFNPGVAKLMDFRVPQDKGTAFCYVLPFNERQALVEYTLFTPSLLNPEEYDEGLQHYIGEVLGIKEYSVQDEEFGIIPMTNYKFPTTEGNIVHLGTAGGQTKGSSGYTFNFVQKHSAAIVASLIQKGHPFISTGAQRFQFYDSVLLRILQRGRLRGKDIFTELFKKNKPQQVLKFLDNETTLAEELKIISSLPTFPFAKAAMQHLL